MPTETEEAVEPQPEGPRHFAPKKKRRRWLRFVLIALAILVVAGVVGGVYVNNKINPSSAGADVQLTVPKGASTAAIAKLLQRNGVIDNATLFRLYVKVK